MAVGALPTLFIGSSSEGLAVAEHLQAALDDYCDATVWNQGTFGPSGTTIGSMVDAARDHDFAVLVLTADDMVIKRDAAHAAARDNVLFEAGLFIGAIGLERTFLVSCRDEELQLPSDLAGVTGAAYRKRQDGNLRAALTPVAVTIRERMQELATRDGAGPAGRSLDENLQVLDAALTNNRSIRQDLVRAIEEAGGLTQAVELAANHDESVPLRNLACAMAALGHTESAWLVAEPIPNLAERRNVGREALKGLAREPANDGMRRLLLRVYVSLNERQREHLRNAALKRHVDVEWPAEPASS